LASSNGLSKRAAQWADGAVVVGLPLLGLLAPDHRAQWYLALLAGFGGVLFAVAGGAAVVTVWGERQTGRLQGVRRGSARVAEGLWDTSLAMWVAACLLAWPLWRAWTGRPIGLVWSLREAGGWPAIPLTLLGVLALDGWLYFKHRMLHTRALFAFHRGHHHYRDPNALSGFSVGPVEALLTFWPLLLVAHPKATHWAPLYFSLVGGFVSLNFYLHCGVRIAWIEALLAPVRLNSSVFHNKHHANAEVNFGEAFTIWDHVCATRDEDKRGPTADGAAL
jgi:sterol desaturase/sphingolipid hydroxylase (fatty acid hydroxylase superfamily)